MSQTEETQEPTQEPEASNETNDESVEEVRIIEGMKPSAAITSADNKPLRYGNRKSRPGAAAPKVAQISSFSDGDDEEEIEMDDLPVRATAPEHLIDSRPAPSEPRSRDDSDRPRREDRPRGERRSRNDRERAPRKHAPSPDRDEETTTTASSEDNNEERPERFGTVENRERRARPEPESQEFRPSRDGRVAPKTPRKPRENSTDRKPRPGAKKKGFFAKIIAFFTGEKEEEKRKSNRSSDGQKSRGGRGRRGPANRQRDGEQGRDGENPNRRRRPRNRKPRPEGEARNRPEGGEGGQKRRRRPRRPREGGNRRDSERSSAE